MIQIYGHCLALRYYLSLLLIISKGSGADGIANYFLKIGLSVIAESLCDIFNLSIATGVFPDSWKIAKVVNQMIVLITDRSQCCRFCPGFWKS